MEIVNFPATQILREIIFGEIRSAKNAVFAIFGTLNFVNLLNTQPSKSAKIPKNKNSEPLNVLKWLILHF